MTARHYLSDCAPWRTDVARVAARLWPLSLAGNELNFKFLYSNCGMLSGLSFGNCWTAYKIESNLEDQGLLSCLPSNNI